jgi:Family of unknown function (DUF5719)
MNGGRKELVFAGAIVAALALGGLFDLVTDDVDAPEPAAAASGDFVARAVFCPPSAAEGGLSNVAVASESETPATVGLGSAEARRLDAGRALILRSENRSATAPTGYSAGIGASSAMSSSGPVGGAGAAQCARSASTRWYFAGGSAALDFDERILLYNPFPDEAVVRLNFYTPQGQETKTSFEEVPVPARDYEIVEINKAIRVKSTVAVGVTAKRGRVVAWKQVFARPEDRPRGVQATLGANGTSTSWYFPDGAVGPGADERLSIVNPNPMEAVVSVTIATAEETLQPQKLLELSVPRRSTLSLKLSDYVARKEFVSISATVNSVNGVGVVAERTVWYSTGALSGVTTDTGLRQPTTKWMLGPATVSPTTDAVAVMNPSPRPARVSISLLRPDADPLVPDELQNLRITAGSRAKLAIGSFTRDRPMIAIVSSDEPVLAERFSYSAADADVGAVMGLPFRLSP